MADQITVAIDPNNSGSQYKKKHRDKGDSFAEVVEAQLADADGNPVGVTAGALDVNIASGAAAGGVSMVDDAPFTVGTNSFNPVGGVYKSAPDSVDDNDGGAFAMTAQRAIHAYLVATTNTVPVKETRPSSTAITTPSMSGSSGTVLASNANRLGATIYNEGAADCLVKLGATASASSYTLKLVSGAYYEVPFGYTGVIDGITASGTAQLRVTELT